MDEREIRMLCVERAMTMPGISSAEDIVATARKLEAFVLGKSEPDPLTRIRANAEEVATGYRPDRDAFSETEIAHMMGVV